MTDRECVEFLQWALPKMRMRWAGFRKVRRQVCRRISRRIAALGLPDAAGYRNYLHVNPDEWKTLASLCRVTISRFYRDKGVFDHVGDVVFTRLAGRRGAGVECWSAGCASGEEAYTLNILWTLRARGSAAGKTLRVLGTDSDPVMLERARRAVYPGGALKDLPPDFKAEAFRGAGGSFELRERFKRNVRFEQQDIRVETPPGPFDIILCRNLVFTYFEPVLQEEVLDKMVVRLREGGVLVIGKNEFPHAVPAGLREEAPAVYIRVS